MRIVSKILLFSFLIPLFSCEKDNSSPQLNLDYFGLNKGAYIEYQVTEISHDIDALIQHDTMYYQLKTLIGDTFVDNQGRIANKFLRYKRMNSTDNWQLTDVWTTIIDDNRGELVEENQRIIKLVFPPSKGKEWNPNAFNNMNVQEFYYAQIHKPYLNFDSTLFVEQDDFLSLVDRRKKHEVYAKGIGLIHKYFKDLKITGFDTLNVQLGKELYYDYLSHGVQ
jgi:hypothetical protein